ncbi:MAG: flagellar assembly protein FliW [Desulfovibrionaceae bacterium]|nr:flagellar assembly protein FliW [Desulfovibrionaceae bacterium]
MEQEKTTIEIDTRLGKRNVDPTKFIEFPRGLVGFEGEHRFVLLQIKPGAPLLVLQSVQNPQLGLLVTDPRCFLDDFVPQVNEAEKSLLQIKDLNDAAILVTVTIPLGEPTKATLNLTGPIIINHYSCIGLQVPQNDIKGPGRVNLYSLGDQESRDEQKDNSD